MDKKKVFMITSIVILIVTIIASAVTYAWYTWSTTSEQETRIVTNLGAARVFYDAGANITNANLKPTATKEEGIVKRITVKTSKSATYKISFNLYLDVINLDNGLKDASFKYALYKEGTETAVAQGNFLNATLKTCETNGTSHIELVMDETITMATSEYTLYIWIDGTMSNPSSMQSQNFNFKLHADGQNAVIGETLVQHINNLYDNAAKSPVENGEEGSKIIYNYAASVSLMNDRLGTMSVGANDGNIRYYGGSPNNYIDIGDVYTKDISIGNWEKFGEAGLFTESSECYAFFDCKTNYENFGFPDEEICNVQMPIMIGMMGASSLSDICDMTTIPAGTPKLYRVIGLFKDVELADGTKKDLVKVVRNEQIGMYSWDQSSEEINGGSGINEWSQADLMKLLNPNYENEEVGGSLYWNSGSGNCYGYDRASSTYTSIPCDFTNSGLNSDVHNKIEEVYWNLGGHDTSEVFSNQFYEYERGENVVVPGTTCSGTFCNDTVKRTTVWLGRVALMYPSDYGYATDLNSCSETLYYYNKEGCYSNDWLRNAMENWLLTPNSSSKNVAWRQVAGGNVEDSGLLHYNIGVSPVFYLDSALGIVTGDGSEGNPYVVR